MRPFLTLHHPEQARACYQAGLWRADTIYSMLARHATRQSTAIALQDGRRALSWAELIAWVDAVAVDLAGRGLVGGDRLSIWMSSRAEVIVTFLACARQGFACNPSLHRSHTWIDVVTLLQRLQARALISERGWGAARTADDVAGAAISSLRAVIDLDGFP